MMEGNSTPAPPSGGCADSTSPQSACPSPAPAARGWFGELPPSAKCVPRSGDMRVAGTLARAGFVAIADAA